METPCSGRARQALSLGVGTASGYFPPAREIVVRRRTSALTSGSPPKTRPKRAKVATTGGGPRDPARSKCKASDLSHSPDVPEVAASPAALDVAKPSAAPVFSDTPSVLQAIALARRERRIGDALKLIQGLAAHHADDRRILLQCLQLLSRIGAWRHVVTLATEAVERRAMVRTASVKVLEAEALFRLSRGADATALMRGVSAERVSGLAAQKLDDVQARVVAFNRTRRLGDAGVTAPANDRPRAVAQRARPLDLDADTLRRLVADPSSAFDEVRNFRLQRRLVAAKQLINHVAIAHFMDKAILTQCFNLLHRIGAVKDALRLLDDALDREILVRNPNLMALEADCLMRAGDRKRAAALARRISRGDVQGMAALALTRLAVLTPARQLNPELAAVESAFDTEQPLKAAALFRAFIDRCKTEARRRNLLDEGDVNGDRTVSTGRASSRDIESEEFVSDIAALTGSKRATANTVLLLSDSIALPRGLTGVMLKDCYPYLVHESLSAATDGRVGLAPDCRRSRKMTDIVPLISRAPTGLEAIIVQAGIVDCAPRVFAPQDVDAVRAVEGDEAAAAVVELAGFHRRHLMGSRQHSVYVPLDQFTASLSKIAREARKRSRTVVLVNIVTPSRSGAKMLDSPLSDNIRDYNAAIADVARKHGVVLADADGHIWSHTDAAECFTRDNYHYNTLGHRYCADLLSRLLLERLTQAEVEPAGLLARLKGRR